MMWRKNDNFKRLYAGQVESVEFESLQVSQWSIVLMYNLDGGSKHQAGPPGGLRTSPPSPPSGTFPPPHSPAPMDESGNNGPPRPPIPPGPGVDAEMPQYSNPDEPMWFGPPTAQRGRSQNQRSEVPEGRSRSRKDEVKPEESTRQDSVPDRSRTPEPRKPAKTLPDEPSADSLPVPTAKPEQLRHSRSRSEPRQIERRTSTRRCWSRPRAE